MRCVLCCLLLLIHGFAPVLAEDRLPAYFIRLPESVTTVFVAETSTSRFHRFDHAGAGSIRELGDSYMSIGENGDGKQTVGDRRTPLGIYFVTDRLDTERMHEKYGYTAFTLDYPNALDRRHRRSGDGIWVHGVDRRGGQRPRLDTDGCIALPNDRLVELESYFHPNVTPVIITRTLAWETESHVEALRLELEDAVRRWLDSRQRGELHTLLSLYDDDFRHWEMSRTDWIAFQTETLLPRRIKAVEAEDLLLLADPVEDDTYLSRFRMTTREPDRTVVVTKRLYWRRDSAGVLKLIAEDSG